MRIVRSCLVAAGLIIGPNAARAYHLIGAGTISCGAWTADRLNTERFAADLDQQWILGFLSGVGGYAGGRLILCKAWTPRPFMRGSTTIAAPIFSSGSWTPRSPLLMHIPFESQANLLGLRLVGRGEGRRSPDRFSVFTGNLIPPRLDLDTKGRRS